MGAHVRLPQSLGRDIDRHRKPAAVACDDPATTLISSPWIAAEAQLALPTSRQYSCGTLSNLVRHYFLYVHVSYAVIDSSRWCCPHGNQAGAFCRCYGPCHLHPAEPASRSREDGLRLNQVLQSDSLEDDRICPKYHYTEHFSEIGRFQRITVSDNL